MAHVNEGAIIVVPRPRADQSSLCRICSQPVVMLADEFGLGENDSERGLCVFGADGRRMHLQRKIRKYLYITVSVDDRLPKIICRMCFKKLESIHSFATMAVKMQEKLNIQLTFHERNGAADPTKKETEEAVKDPPKDESSTEEMEVRLDPMLILQYCSENAELDREAEKDVDSNDEENANTDVRTRNDQLLTEADIKVEYAENENCCHDNSETQKIEDVDKSRMPSSNDTACPSAVYPSALLNAIARQYRCAQCSVSFHSELGLQAHNWQHIAQKLNNNNNNNNNDAVGERHMMPALLPIKRATSGDRLYYADVGITDPDATDSNESNVSGNRNDRNDNAPNGSRGPRLDRPLNLRKKRTLPGYAAADSLFRTRPYHHPFFPSAASIQSMLTSSFGRSNALAHFSCPICAKRISTKGNLKVHLDTHRPKGKYDCDICGRIFKTQCNLHRHKEYHQGVQFPCIVCGRVYPTNSTLRAHSITHSDLRPHKCPLCDKTFKRNQDLKFHINQHTGARPYECPYCPKAFASSGNCFSHRKRMHPEEVERDKERAAKIMR